MDLWANLEANATPSQKAVLAVQKQRNPPLPGQTPQQWLLQHYGIRTQATSTGHAQGGVGVSQPGMQSTSQAGAGGPQRSGFGTIDPSALSSSPSYNPAQVHAPQAPPNSFVSMHQVAPQPNHAYNSFNGQMAQAQPPVFQPFHPTPAVSPLPQVIKAGPELIRIDSPPPSTLPSQPQTLDQKPIVKDEKPLVKPTKQPTSTSKPGGAAKDAIVVISSPEAEAPPAGATKRPKSPPITVKPAKAPKLKKAPVAIAAAAGPSRLPSSASPAPAPAPKPPVVYSMEDVRAALKPELLKDKPANLFKYLRTRTVKDEPAPPWVTPNPTELLEILSAIQTHASDRYLVDMAQDDRYVMALRKWLLRCSKEPKIWEGVAALLLQILARTDMPVDYVIDHKLIKVAKAAVDKAKSEDLASKDEVIAAYDKYEKYVREVLLPSGKLSEPAEAEVPKKRKMDDGSAKEVTKAQAGKPQSSSTKPLPSSSKTQSSATKASSIPSKAQSASAKPAAPPKATTTDMSFFGTAPISVSTPKPKPKLPEFKKRDSASNVNTTTTSAPARSPVVAASTGLLAQTLSKLRQSESRQNPGLAKDDNGAAADLKPVAKKPNRKGHTVKFSDSVPNGRPLEEIKIFESYRGPEGESEESDSTSGGHDMAYAHTMEIGEGRALHLHDELEEEIEWYEPPEYTGVGEITPPTPEVAAQEERELGILAVTYPEKGVPPDADETDVKIVTQDQDTGTWYTPDALRPAQITAPPTPVQTSVSALLGSLQPTLFAGLVPQVPVQNHDYTGYAQQAQYQPPHDPYAYNNPQAQYAAQGWGQATPTPDQYGAPAAPAWGGQNNYAGTYGGTYNNNGGYEQGGFGGRGGAGGRGRGKRRK